MTLRRGNEIAVFKSPTALEYPNTAPFGPGDYFPESLFSSTRSDQSNGVYGAVRQALRMLYLDEGSFGTQDWNPLKGVVLPGDVVFIKPNMISDRHQVGGDWRCMLTHGSVIRAVVDYVYIALQGSGKIIIGDAPQTDADFEAIATLTGLRRIQQLYRDERQFDIEILDLRGEYWIERDGIYVEKRKLSGDPAGKVEVDLSGDSLFAVKDSAGLTYY